MISIVLADDQPLIRAGIAMLLQAQSDMQVLAEVSDGAEAVAAARTLHPDLIVMDLKMPGLDGVSATQLITDLNDTSGHLTKVLVLTTFEDDELVYGALRAGASGFLLKQAAASDLPAAARRVVAGEAWLDPGIAGKVIRAVADTRDGDTDDQTVGRLTPRERELLMLMAEGLSNDEIARRLHLSNATVKTHVARILMKTGCHDRAKAIVLAYRSGLVVPPARH